MMMMMRMRIKDDKDNEDGCLFKEWTGLGLTSMLMGGMPFLGR